MTKQLDKVSIAVVGVGGWGKNLARNYSQIPGAHVKYFCDLDQAKLDAMQQQFPAENVTKSFDDLIGDEDLEAIVIATTGPTHFKLCKQALLAGKDVYVEKPMVLSVDEANELVAIAKSESRILMVGHLLEYHPVCRA